MQCTTKHATPRHGHSPTLPKPALLASSCTKPLPHGVSSAHLKGPDEVLIKSLPHGVSSAHLKGRDEVLLSRCLPVQVQDSLDEHSPQVSELLDPLASAAVNVLGSGHEGGQVASGLSTTQGLHSVMLMSSTGGASRRCYVETECCLPELCDL
jgi:hypothetical protein